MELSELAFKLQIKEMHPQNYIRYLLWKNKRLPIELTPSARMVMLKEWHHWKIDYLPEGGIKGKTVLDVGAGCGETALFYFYNGAEKVICIEPDPMKFMLLKKNARAMKWNIEAHKRRFKADDMFLQFDFAKIDCEGGEIELVQLPALPPLVVEIHSIRLVGKIQKAFPSMEIKRNYRFFPVWLGKVSQESARGMIAESMRTLPQSSPRSQDNPALVRIQDL